MRRHCSFLLGELGRWKLHAWANEEHAWVLGFSQRDGIFLANCSSPTSFLVEPSGLE